jgi:MFS transporter, YNFM family, putative membrane transport protein
MIEATHSGAMPRTDHQALATFARSAVIGLMAFLTVVDLFAAQAILPSLAKVYGVSPAAMGLAVNASTLGMAISGLAVSLFSRRIDRRRGIVASLVLLAIPTALLAWAPDLMTFAALRIAQGLCMAAAFTLTLAYLGEEYSAADAASAFAAYITGNVASNLVGRLISAGVAEQLGLAASFYVFAALNLAGAALVFFAIHRTPPMTAMAPTGRTPFQAWRMHFGSPQLRAAFGIGFCILFAFIGTFTYVNFVLARSPLSVGAMQLGLVYFVFLPSIFTTPLAGRAITKLGNRGALLRGLAIAGAGLVLLIVPNLPAVLLGLTLVAIGTFLAQAVATGFVGRTAQSDRGAASGLYLASYFAGGLAGSAVLGQLFDRFGWLACVAGISIALMAAQYLAQWMEPRCTGEPV